MKVVYENDGVLPMLFGQLARVAALQHYFERWGVDGFERWEIAIEDYCDLSVSGFRNGGDRVRKQPTSHLEDALVDASWWAAITFAPLLERGSSLLVHVGWDRDQEVLFWCMEPCYSGFPAEGEVASAYNGDPDVLGADDDQWILLAEQAFGEMSDWD